MEYDLIGQWGHNYTRTPHHVMEDINESYEGFRGGRGFKHNSDEILEWATRSDAPLNEYDAKWFLGEDSEKWKGDPQASGFEKLVYEAVDASEQLQKSCTPGDINKAKEAWVQVQDKLLERKQHYLNQGKDIAKPSYDTDFGLSPIDEASKTAFYMQQKAIEGLGVMEYYRTAVFPKLFWEHLEELADAHVLSREPDTEEKRVYIETWTSFLRSKKIDPEKYDIFAEGSNFLENLAEFYLSRGTNYIGLLGSDLYEEVRQAEVQALNEGSPVKIPKSYENNIVNGMYPNATKHLAAGSFERVLASWSISAHMFKEMSEEQILDVWQETDRLLKEGGMATFFPLCHYGEDPEYYIDTIKKYNSEKGGHLEIESFGPSGQAHGGEGFGKDKTLVLRKLQS